MVKLIDNLDKEKDYLKNNSKSLDDKKIKKERKEKQLQEKKEEEERLNKLLPSEVVKLRKELVEGEPCPVCGSIHHSLTVIEDLSSLNDEELSNSKEKNAKDIEIITKELEDIKNEIISITAKVQNSKENILSDKENIARYVKDITSWEELLDNQKLKGALIKLRSLWQEKQNSEKENKEIIVNLNLKLEGFKSEIKSYDQQIREKSEKIGDIEKELNSEIVERNQLLGGKQTEDVENEMEKVVNESNEKVEKARATYHSLQIKLSADKTKISQLEEQIKKTVIEIHADETSLNEWLSLAKPAIKNDYFVELMNYDMSKVEAERKVLSQLTQDLENSNSILKEKEKDIIEHESSANRPSIDDNIESLISRQNEIKELIHTANSRRAEIKIRLENNDKEKSSRESLLKELEKKRVPYENWQALNILFGSQTGDKFKEIAQGYTLDFLLLYANKHLKDLAPRYELQRISDTLALQVIDVDMMGESRSVHSLSGGESFLVSLALALGLSSLSSNRMNVESLFIDEGFGSLDIDTLRVAMEALERLQMQGRKIGVISHVEEMTERIAVQIQVKKEGNGRSIVLIK